MGQYKFWVNAGQDGEIISVIMNSKSVAPDAIHTLLHEPATDADWNHFNIYGGHKYFLSNQVVVRKPVVTLSVDNGTIQADGSHTATVTVTGLPADQASVQIQAGNNVYTVPNGEPLEITADTPGPIGVQLQDKFLDSNSLVVVAVSPPVVIGAPNAS